MLLPRQLLYVIVLLVISPLLFLTAPVGCFGYLVGLERTAVREQFSIKGSEDEDYKMAWRDPCLVITQNESEILLRAKEGSLPDLVTLQPKPEPEMTMGRSPARTPSPIVSDFLCSGHS